MASGISDKFDDILVTIAKRTKQDEDTYNLGRALDISIYDVEGANVENGHGITHMGTLKMLRYWQMGQRPSDEVDNLKDGLRKANMFRHLSNAFPEDVDKDLPCRKDSIDESEEYKMSSIPRGKCLIINNKTFDEQEPREGTDQDCEKLKKTFDYLGFEVTTEKDLNGMEIETRVEELSKHDHSALDCVVLVILSHGSEGVICGVDEDEVDIHEMIAMFDADKCPTLIGKPKLFFIQACRGDKKDTGVETSDGIGPAGDGLTDQERDYIEARKILYPFEGDCKATDGKGSKRRKIPTHNDVLLGYCTRPGYVSWRHKTRGSLYIQALTEVFDRCATHRDLAWMMTRVTKRVAKKAANQYKQSAPYVSSLQNELKFYPEGQ